MLIRVMCEQPAGPMNPRRIELPSAGEFGYDPIGQNVFLEIPAEDWPFSREDKIDVKSQFSPHGPIVTHLGEDEHKAWHAHLDKRYQEHAGRFRPIIR